MGLGSTRKRRGSSTAETGSAGGDYEHTSFTFLGFTFRAREAKGRNGEHFTGFLPAMSTEALKAKSTELRGMRIHRRTTLTLDDLARWLNPIVAGWMNYYGRFYRSGMYPLLQRVSSYVRRWTGRSTGDCGTKRFQRWWTGLIERQPALFAQWKWVRAFSDLPTDEKSPVKGDFHAGICGAGGAGPPRHPTVPWAAARRPSVRWSIPQASIGWDPSHPLGGSSRLYVRGRTPPDVSRSLICG